LLRVLGDREDAADMFQETWLRAYRAYPRLDSERGVHPWLYAIATNLCRNRARDSARRARVVVPDKEELPAADTIGKEHRFDHVARHDVIRKGRKW
jgi:RNA polymerase sigma-70 factor, ECF subfamily